MPPVTRAVVLAAGLGTRMRAAGDAPLTEEQARAAAAGHKAMMPFGRPFLDHVLHNLAEAGVTRACLVTAPAHDEVRAYYGALPTTRLADRVRDPGRRLAARPTQSPPPARSSPTTRRSSSTATTSIR